MTVPGAIWVERPTPTKLVVLSRQQRRGQGGVRYSVRCPSSLKHRSMPREASQPDAAPTLAGWPLLRRALCASGRVLRAISRCASMEPRIPMPRGVAPSSWRQLTRLPVAVRSGKASLSLRVRPIRSSDSQLLNVRRSTFEAMKQSLAQCGYQQRRLQPLPGRCQCVTRRRQTPHC